jgi:hypothetical protein
VSVWPKRVGFALWELPQNVLGAALLAAAYLTRRVTAVEYESDRVFIESRGLGVSLGAFVFWFGDGNRYFQRDAIMRRHEYGHTFQSRYLGPLYLLLVGVPSVSRVIYGVVYREVTGRRWTGYYDGYPENWADRLGGISVTERRRAMSPPSMPR